ncbi:MAG: branched-chain amino acid transaminase [Segetibacter sp.]|nr:branched-chain amino acid transaminase [Segetibacter sp.]
MYYDQNTIIHFNGEFVKASEAKTDLYGQSLHYGYAAFEGIRAYNTQNGVKIFKPFEHYERLKYSCESVGIPYPYNTDELIEISYEVLKRNNLQDAYIRPLVICTPNMSLTKGKESQLLIAAWDWGAYLGDKMLDIAVSSFRRISPASFKVDAKVSGHYINSIMATQEAKDLGYDEALLLDVNGFVAEGPGANIFVEREGVLYTPQLGSILPGITRATVIEICSELGIEVVEKQLLPEEVKGADSAFYVGTAAEVIGIGSLDRVPFTKAWSEALGSKVQKAYKTLVLEKSHTPELAVA